VRTLTTRPLALLAALGAAVALAGCSGGDDGTSTVPGDAPPSTSVPQESVLTPSPSLTTKPPAAQPSEPIGPADLTIVVDDGTGSTVTRTLTCEPAGGDVEAAQEACDQLGAIGTAVFAGTPPDAMCTQQYGGPQTATVTGTVGGGQVQSTFSRVNGCEIARWDAVSALFGEVGDPDS
jgi:hypothetical protein